MALLFHLFIFLFSTVSSSRYSIQEHEQTKKNSNKELHNVLDWAFKCIGQRRHLIDVFRVRTDYWPSIRDAMDWCLTLLQMDVHFDYQQNTERITLPTAALNKFLNFILQFGVISVNGSHLRLMDEYYLSAKQVGIRPDAVTFNTLLRANRMCLDGIRGKLVEAHLNEMIEYGIDADAYTILELLNMCSKCPQAKTMNGTMTNKDVADAEFKYYLNHMLLGEADQCKRFPPYAVFSSYLKVYTKDADVKGMLRILDLADRYGIGAADSAERKSAQAFHKCVATASMRRIHEAQKLETNRTRRARARKNPFVVS